MQTRPAYRAVAAAALQQGAAACAHGGCCVVDVEVGGHLAALLSAAVVCLEGCPAASAVVLELCEGLEASTLLTKPGWSWREKDEPRQSN